MDLPTATVAVDAGLCPITLVCISDTHNTEPAHIPPGDVLLHAGDLSQYGTFDEIQRQLTWLASQPHQHKVIIAGNHDLLLDQAFVAAHPDRELNLYDGKRRTDLVWGDVRYLERELLELNVQGKERSIRVFGTPWTPRCGNWAFQYRQGEGSDDANMGQQMSMHRDNAMPNGTDVVLVHGPPITHLDDGGKGCKRLLAELWRARPKVVVCGHIHSGRGIEWLPFDRAQSWYEDAMLGRRQWIFVVCLAIWSAWLVVTSVLGFSTVRQRTAGTLLVNAAVVGGRGNRERRDPLVVTA